MKRSDMVDLITIEFNLAEGMADEILALIESKGMKPPYIIVNDLTKFPLMMWEPEDEKK